MNIELTETKAYSFKVGDKLLDGFVIISEWNGFTELRRPNGDRVIVHGMASATKPGFADLMSDICGGLQGVGKAPLGVRIVTASPTILELIEASLAQASA